MDSRWTTDGGGGNEAWADWAAQATAKVPPYWEPSLEKKGYPFRIYDRDLLIWAVGSELPPERMAPAVVQRLGGMARQLAREVPPEVLSHGRVDGAGNLVPGLEVDRRLRWSNNFSILKITSFHSQ